MERSFFCMARASHLYMQAVVQGGLLSSSAANAGLLLPAARATAKPSSTDERYARRFMADVCCSVERFESSGL